MNKSDLEKCQEEYEEHFEKTLFQKKIDKIVKDIIDSENNAMAMEFTRTIGKLLAENGILVDGQLVEYADSISGEILEVNYGFIFDGLDCTEHDRKFTDRISQLEKQVSELESELSVKENLLKTRNGLCGEESDYEKLMEEILSYEPTNKEDDVAQFNYDSLTAFNNAVKKRNRIAELENRHQSDCITINQLHTALDVMIEKYQRLREIHGL